MRPDDTQVTQRETLLSAPSCTLLPRGQESTSLGFPKKKILRTFIFGTQLRCTVISYSALAGVLIDTDPQSGSGALALASQVVCVSKRTGCGDEQDEFR